MIRRPDEKERYLLVFLIIFALIFARYCAYGFQYYYQLDDYIQYHNYTAGEGEVWSVIMRLGMLAARPLAGLADVFIWEKFFPVMLLGVAVISAMFAVQKGFKSSFWNRLRVFSCVYALAPGF